MKSQRHEGLVARALECARAWKFDRTGVDELSETLSNLLELAYTLGKKDQVSNDLDTANKLREEAS